MVHIFRRKNTKGLLYSLSKELCFTADRFADEVSDNLRKVIPMKEAFVTYVDALSNDLSFHHGPTVTTETVKFYENYPVKILDVDYMAREAFKKGSGVAVLDREAIDESSHNDFVVESQALSETHNKSMALYLLATPWDFTKEVRRRYYFLQCGVTALTIYRDEYDDFFGERERALVDKYFSYIRMGLLNAVKENHGESLCPEYKGIPIFPVGEK